MKCFEVGCGGLYTDIELNISKTPNKYGTLYYFKDRIYLTKNTPITDYSIWASDTGIVHLVLQDSGLLEELRLLKQSINKVDASLNFKEYGAEQKLYVKLGKACGEIPPNCELCFCISIFGVFKKADGQLFLQLDVFEQSTKKLSLLGKRKADDKESVAKRSYVPNSLG